MFNRQSCWPFCKTFRRSQMLLTVNDRWPAVILTADKHSSYLHIQKKKRKKKWFLHSHYSVLLLIHSQVFDFNINIQFCYLLYIVFSFFFFFSFLVLVNVHKLFKSIEQLLLFRNPKNRITLSQWLIIKRSQV